MLVVFACVEWCPTHIVFCFSFVFLRRVASDKVDQLPAHGQAKILLKLALKHQKINQSIKTKSKQIQLHPSWSFTRVIRRR
jgi:hypothetical protein